MGKLSKLEKELKKLEDTRYKARRNFEQNKRSRDKADNPKDYVKYDGYMRFYDNQKRSLDLEIKSVEGRIADIKAETKRSERLDRLRAFDRTMIECLTPLLKPLDILVKEVRQTVDIPALVETAYDTYVKGCVGFTTQELAPYTDLEIKNMGLKVSTLERNYSDIGRITTIRSSANAAQKRANCKFWAGHIASLIRACIEKLERRAK